MQTRTQLILASAALAFAVVACQASPNDADDSNGDSSGGDGGEQSGGGAGTGARATGGTSATGGTAGSSGGTAGSSGGTTGTAGAGGGAGQQADAGSPDGPVMNQQSGGAAGCATGDPLCFDFESGALPAGWTATNATNPRVEKGRASAGEYALHFVRLKTEKPLIRRTALPGITNSLWGRMFLYVTPAMPEGHGALVAGFDQANNWYEVGFQFRNFHGNWHVPAGVPERWMNSQVKVPADKWVCVEWSFNGAKPDVTRIWSDGKEVPYNQSASGPGPEKVQAFKKIEIGFTPYHGSDMTDMWVDNLVLAPSRIGCGS